MEPLLGLYKSKVFYHRGLWHEQDDIEHATLEWVQWYNEGWPYAELAYLSPKAYKERHMEAHSELTLAG